jgi:hypothetical protein
MLPSARRIALLETFSGSGDLLPALAGSAHFARVIVREDGSRPTDRQVTAGLRRPAAIRNETI